MDVIMAKEGDINNKLSVSRRKLCKTLSGNIVWTYTITNKGKPEDLKKRKGIVVTARVHPGESNGSFMMKGFLDFITSDAIEAF